MYQSTTHTYTHTSKKRGQNRKIPKSAAGENTQLHNHHINTTYFAEGELRNKKQARR
jgi:hypothetical protein